MTHLPYKASESQAKQNRSHEHILLMSDLLGHVLKLFWGTNDLKYTFRYELLFSENKCLRHQIYRWSVANVRVQASWEEINLIGPSKTVQKFQWDRRKASGNFYRVVIGPSYTVGSRVLMRSAHFNELASALGDAWRRRATGRDAPFV